MEETQEVPPTETTQEPSDIPTEPTPTQAPTRDVKTFWNRLDEVLEQLETEVQMTDQKPYRSAIFQPDRISLTSINALQQPQMAGQALIGQPLQNHQQAETFSSFKIRFTKALVGVKSIQCLSAVIPIATTNIPQGELVFYYYKLRNLTLSSLGAWSVGTTYIQGDVVSYAGSNYVSLINTNLAIIPSANPTAWYDCSAIMSSPNYYDLNTAHIGACYFFEAVGTEYPPEIFPASPNQDNNFNRTFKDYTDIVTGLQSISASQFTNFFGGFTVGNIGQGQGNISFVYNSVLNKIQMVPSASEIAAGYFFLPAGCLDPNVIASQQLLNQSIVNGQANTLNMRTGFTWNGVFPNPATLANPFVNTQLKNALYWYIRPSEPGGDAFSQNIITANSYGDLVYTSVIKLYCDVTFGSTQDSTGQGGLLSIIPTNTATMGVGYYQSSFDRPLTKIPEILPEITISMTTDNGSPFYLPLSADVTIELAIEYK